MIVYLFAGPAEAAGVKEVRINTDKSMTLGELRKELVAMFPDHGFPEKLAISWGAVNQTYCRDHVVVKPTDEVAFIPPVSGG